MKSTSIRESDQHLTEEGLAHGSRMASVNSILLLVRGSALHSEIRVGKVVAPVAFNQDVKSLVPAKNVDPDFLLYFFLANRSLLLGKVHSAGNGAGVLETDLLKSLEFPLPPLPEQRSIAGTLRAFDDLIETNRQLVSDLRELSRLSFANLTDYVERPLSEVARLAVRRAKVSEVDPSSRFLGLDSFSTDGRGIHSVGDMTGLTGTQVRFEAGDLLYGKLRPYFRKVDRPNYDGYCSPEIWTLKPQEGASPEFLESVISSPEFTDFAAQGSGGSRMPRADWSHVCDFVVKVPRTEDMERISRESRILWESRWKLTEEAQELTVARDTLLPLLLSGKITPNSAAKLLEDVTK